MQLFPKGQVINLHPWEYNEVPVLLGAALRQPVPVVILHLTRPPIHPGSGQRLALPRISRRLAEPTWSGTTFRGSRKGAL